MRSTLSVMIVSLCVSLGHQPHGAVVAQKDREGEVRRALQSIRDSVMNCRVDAYARLWDDPSSIFVVRGDRLKPAADYLEMWRGICRSGGGIRFDSDGDEITIYGDMALVTGLSTWTFKTADGTTTSGRQRNTTILRKSSGQWKIVHAHGSPLVDDPVPPSRVQT